MSTTLPEPPSAGTGVHCCLCLNTDRGRVPATTMVDGYALCDDHARVEQWMVNADQSFNFTATVNRLRKSKAANAT